MKPKLGRTVWCIYEWSLEAQKVYALGEQSFITDNYCKNTIKDSQEYEYDLYGYRWFTSLAKAKKQIMQEYRDMYPFDYNAKLIQRGDDYYEIG